MIGNMWILKCKNCNRPNKYVNQNNYNRALQGSRMCNGCSRIGQKRTPEQRKRIKFATIIAMKSPQVRTKIIDGMSNIEVKKKMSENAKNQMRIMLATDIDKVSWSWKISKATKKKWLSRTNEEKENIVKQINEARKVFINKLSDVEYKRNHVRKILHSGITKDTKPELKVKTILELNEISYSHPFQLEDKVFDFYLPQYHLLIEVDGVYYHGKGLNENQMNNMQRKHKINDEYKTSLASNCGFNLLRIWEDEIEVNNVMERIYQHE
jgi:very-short-patch-repair endonuclease